MIMKQMLILLVSCLVVAYAQQPSCDLHENEITSDRATKLYKGQTIFTLKFLEAANHASPKENLFFSPYSLYQVLLIMYFGSKDTTEMTLKKGLELHWTDSKSDVASAYKTEKLLRSKRFGEDVSNLIKFSSVDKLFFANQIGLSKCMTDFFTEEIEKIDFLHKPDESRIIINNWVANNTKDEIKDILNPDAITSNTKVAVANAAYFKGTWVSKFKETETKKELFYAAPDNIKFVDMMHVKGSYSHAANEKLACHIIELPYKTQMEKDSSDYEDPEISMFIMLPSTQTGLDEVLSRLTDDILADVVADGMHKQVDVKLPKFTIEKTLELNQVLAKMGLGEVIDSNADFSGFVEDIKNEHISFDKVVQKAKISVDEQGSTAAASTVGFSFRSSRPLEPIHFHCNHPFIFFIYDHTNKAVLFTGVYRTPE